MDMLLFHDKWNVHVIYLLCGAKVINFVIHYMRFVTPIRIRLIFGYTNIIPILYSRQN